MLQIFMADPRTGGATVGSFAGELMNVINIADVISDALQSVNLNDLEDYVDGTFVAQKSAIMDSILGKLKDDDDELLKQLAQLVKKRIWITQ